ncbi:MAG: hypothetical protein ABI402_03000 [Ferruginibacter sp.]
MTFEMNHEAIDFFISEEFEPLYDLFENNSIKKKFENPRDRIDYLYERLEYVEFIKAKMEYLCSHFSFFATTYNNWDYDDFVNMSSELTEMARYLKSDIAIFEAESGQSYFKPFALKLDKATKKIKGDVLITKEDENRRAILQLILKNFKNELFADTILDKVGNAVFWLTNERFLPESTSQQMSVRKYPVDIYSESIELLEKVVLQLRNDKDNIKEKK